MPDPNRIALPNAPHELTQLTGQPVAYTKIYKAVLEGRVLAKRDGARWFIHRSDLQAVATALGLTPAPKTGKPGRPRQAASVEHAAA